VAADGAATVEVVTDSVVGCDPARALPVAQLAVAPTTATPATVRSSQRIHGGTNTSSGDPGSA
jgi:hypothetical protein